MYFTPDIYMNGLRCAKSIYLERDDINLGLEWPIEHLRRQYLLRKITDTASVFKKYPITEKSWNKAIQETIIRLESGESIVNAAFRAGDYHGISDFIYRKDKTTTAVLIGIEHSLWQVEKELDRISYNIYVCKSSGIKIDKVEIYWIKSWKTSTDINSARELFLKEDVTIKVCDNIKKVVVPNLDKFSKVLQYKETPEIEIGQFCAGFKPCKFKRKNCWKYLGNNSVFNLIGISNPQRYDLLKRGHFRIEDIPKSFYFKKADYAIKQYKSNKGLEVNDSVKLIEFLKETTLPYYYLDFEAYKPDVPYQTGTQYKDTITFQYSLHIQKTSSINSIEHKEYLGHPESDERRALFTKLITELGNKGTIFAYSKGYEESRLKDIKKLYPDLNEPIDAILKRMKDLIEPFRYRQEKTWVYHSNMKGSASLKAVLPALIPDIRYDDLEIRNGTEATRQYEHLFYCSEPSEREKLRDNLLAYCKRDTWAMVKIHQVLINITCSKH